jgi:DNA-binding NarL/FixJ family response regulator
VSPEDPEVAFLKTLRLLHVEDDPGAREEIGEFLERRAGAVVTATDGEEGLAAYRAQPAQIIVTDIWMPHMDGLAMAREIRNLDPGVLIIVTTAFEDWDCLSRSIATGIDQYVLKPIQRTRLDFALLTCAHRLRLVASARTSANSLDADERQRLVQLTPREREVLACIGRGQPSREIGQGLGISPKTVRAHQANLMIKLGLHKGTALAAFAVRAGIS